MARLHNVRLGFACNSSSTHSLLLKKDVVFLPDMQTLEFGWDYWTASTVETKLAWFMYSVYLILGEDLCKAQGWDALLPFPWDHKNNFTNSYYVDHQSHFSFPTMTMDSDGKLVPDDSTIGFVKAMIDLLSRDEVFIIGGNDNGGYPEDHPYFHNGINIGDYPAERGLIYGRWRLDNDLLTIYSFVNGNRFTLAFGDNCEITSPMLVDIKLTDYCNIGCKYCYQGSTVAGKHADLSTVTSLLLKLSANNCFEVAFGGGEPTTYPYLDDVVQFCNDINMIANITSKDLSWWVNPANHETARKFSAVAASVESYDEMMKWINNWPFPHDYDYYSDSGHQYPILNFQVIDGIVPFEELVKMNDEFTFQWTQETKEKPRLTITVLGYKTTGRGLTVNPPYKGDWVKVLQQKENFGFFGLCKIDTVIAQNYDLKALFDLYEPSVIDTEGIWSYYYDCTSMKAGVSSYCEELHPFEI